MKTEFILALIMIFGILIAGCKQKEQNVEVKEMKIDIINDEFPQAQVEIAKVLDEIYKSGQAKNLELLSSYHLYGPKFTEFKNGEPRADAEKNEKGEREIFSAISNLDYDLRDLKVNVFGDVAIATFHGYFEFDMGEDHISIQAQSTLVFAKADNTWKIVHEHFSPLNLEQTE